MRERLIICVAGIGVLGTLPLRGQIPDRHTHSLDSLALYIDSQCDTDEAKLEMLYRWMTSTMSYNPYPVFEQKEATDVDLVNRTIETRLGVCRHFAKLFRMAGERMKIPVHEVEGYVKGRSGQLMTALHAWCAARLGEQWYIYDPTWGMGNVGGQSPDCAPSMDYCKMPPEVAIHTHMPCDPIWQLLERPVSYEAFDNGQIDPTRGQTFHFNDSIRTYLQQTPAEQLEGVNRRMKANGRTNSLTDYYMQVNKANITVYRNREVSTLFREALRLSNHAIDILSHLDSCRRHPPRSKLNPSEQKQLIADARDSNRQALLMLGNLQVPDTSLYAKAIRSLLANIEDVERKLNLSAKQSPPNTTAKPP